MSVNPTESGLDQQVGLWREQLAKRPGVDAGDVDELTDHLLGHVDALESVGLSPDEAFLVAVKRVGDQHAIAREFAEENSARLWRTLVLEPEEPGPKGWRDPGAMLVFAMLAGLAARLTFGVSMDEGGSQFTVALAGSGVFLALAGWFWWRRRPPVLASVVTMLAAVAVGLLTQAFYPWRSDWADTQFLSLMHLPIMLAVVLGIAHARRAWRTVAAWTDYLRFVGELVVYYALIALGGGVLVGLTAALLDMLGLNPEPVIEWVVPLGVGGAIVVAAWLVEAKKSAVENMAPVLTAVFTPLFTVLLLGFLTAMAATGGIEDRDVLIIVDLVLVVVWGLVVFSVVSRRDGPPRLGDWLQLALVLVTLVVDVVVLAAMAGRIQEFGASPNKVAALGENLVLLVNLAWSGWLLLGFLRRRRPVLDLERWQSRYLPVVGVWAAVVVVVLPLVFGFR
ncbi:permease prefix domain 1-containing protein [Aestuariimicrobium ganziense]|uniref:permease prefix domain 1-containing protein n=1 Tax=Aestuariimicrobium ganziense TaxID=2773677 RepID=UPI0019459AE3|nr:permease prefix domain 1-containing protein [Aestuariimicrobium ganziense]